MFDSIHGVEPSSNRLLRLFYVSDTVSILGKMTNTGTLP
jgi:hypothetical protein